MNIGRGSIERMFCQGLLLFGLIALASCNDFRWRQKSSVYAPNVGFEVCIKAGIAEVPAVSIARFEYDRYSLNVHFQKPLPGIRAFVQKRNTPVADIAFAGTGWHESNEERSEIAPILAVLTDAIKRHCSRSS